jgi:hypothetical protein
MPIQQKEEVILVIGAAGSDAPYSVLTPHGLKHVPGNNPFAREAFEALTKSFAKLQQIAQTGEQAVR